VPTALELQFATMVQPKGKKRAIAIHFNGGRQHESGENWLKIDEE
jgi:hypothetical protein